MKRPSPLARALPLALLVLAHATAAQTATAPRPDAAASNDEAAHEPVAAFAWLAGCWKGSVNQRDFREMWLPLAGNMLVGAGQQVSHDEVQDYEFLRLEAKPDGVFFTQFSGEGKAISFRLASTTRDQDDVVFTFANTADAFPARLVYRKGTQGWLYETIEGTLNGTQRRVIYPLRRVDCGTDALIAQ